MGRPDGIGLREAVAAVRAELAAAMADGADSSLKFDVGSIQLEFAVDVTGGGEAGVEVKVWVLSLSAGANAQVSNSHRITVTLNPVNAITSRPQRISDQEPAYPPRPR